MTTFTEVVVRAMRKWEDSPLFICVHIYEAAHELKAGPIANELVLKVVEKEIEGHHCVEEFMFHCQPSQTTQEQRRLARIKRYEIWEALHCYAQAVDAAARATQTPTTPSQPTPTGNPAT